MRGIPVIVGTHRAKLDDMTAARAAECSQRASLTVPFLRVRLNPADRVIRVGYGRGIRRLRRERQIDGYDEDSAAREALVHRGVRSTILDIPCDTMEAQQP